MKKISLVGFTFNKAIVDDEDYERLNKYNWHQIKGKTVTYAAASIEGKKVYMHHLILPKKNGYIVDHIHHDGLDNRKEELRYVTHSQSGANTRAVARTNSGYKGVSWHKQRQKWVAEIKVEGMHKSLGLYHNKEEAALAYNKAALKYWGEFAHLNEVKIAQS